MSILKPDVEMVPANYPVLNRLEDQWTGVPQPGITHPEI